MAAGRFDDAESVATALLDQDDRWSFAARITLGSVLRQTGRHEAAREIDNDALARADDGATRAEALTSLAADAVGLVEATVCADLLTGAARAVPVDDRRGMVRLSWVRAEHALLSADPTAAVGHARLALADARAMGWPRHIAKSLLFLGSALEAARAGEARLRLQEAWEQARAAGALPIERAAADLLARVR